MASITIQHSHKNLLFAAEVANQTGATFEENGSWITISDSPRLVIPRYSFNEAFDPEGQRRMRNDPRLDSAWRSLLLNKRGYLEYYGDNEISITDEKPGGKERPMYPLRFDSPEAKMRVEDLANRLGFSDLREFIITAIDTYLAQTQEQAGMTTEQVAQAIYREVFGHVDDKRFRAKKVGEIHDWLESGDLDDDETISDLAEEWSEFDADEVNRRGRNNRNG